MNEWVLFTSWEESVVSLSRYASKLLKLLFVLALCYVNNKIFPQKHVASYTLYWTTHLTDCNGDFEYMRRLYSNTGFFHTWKIIRAGQSVLWYDMPELYWKYFLATLNHRKWSWNMFAKPSHMLAIHGWNPNLVISLWMNFKLGACAISLFKET